MRGRLRGTERIMVVCGKLSGRRPDEDRQQNQRGQYVE
jgi:hypothetical protein